MGELLSALNPAQRMAVLHEKGPLLVLAGAGSGKTRALTHRVAHLIAARGVPPWRILAVTFTNKAAGEMRSRLELLLSGSELPWVATFHSTCVRVLRREISALGLARDFSIYDEQDQERLVRDCLRDLAVPEAVLAPRAAVAVIDSLKNRGIAPQNCDRRDAWHDSVARCYETYQGRLRRANALDFGDLLLCTLRLLEDKPEVLDRYRDRFLHVLVDEYQDTNRVQYRLANLLSSAHRNLCVVGDEDQSIYRWRGADLRNILDFEHDYPDATVIRLEQNYRSTGNILAAAGAVVAHNVARKGKTLWTANPGGERVTIATLPDDLDEARYVVSEIGRLCRGGRALREFAIFYRTNVQSRSFEEALVRGGIPYTIVGGVRFFSRAEVKDVLAYLRLLVNPADSVAARRVINVPPRGIGAATVAKIAALEEEAGGLLPACALALDKGVLAGTAANKVGAFVSLMDLFRSQLDEVAYPELAHRIIEQTGYGKMLREATSPEASERLQNLEELLRSMQEHAATAQDLSGYLEQVALVTDLDGYDRAADRATLMTLHAAKGLEFPVVFMVGMEEGLFPHARAADGDIEEERRLCYVGMTRARIKLYLTHACRRRVYSSFQNNRPSCFLSEIPDRLADRVGRRPNTRAAASRGGPADREEALSWSDDEVRVVYDDEDGLRVGARVQHAAFGIGTVRNVEGRGENRKVTVAFRSAGTRKLVLKFAGLMPA